MIKDLVTIIVPVYNVEKFLPDCLLSIENQTYKNIEVILVNDGSTDSCPTLLKDFCKKHSYAKLINQVNQGLAAARNTGLKYAKGEYINFFDSDDVMYPQAIEKFVTAIKSTNCDFVSAEFNSINEDEKYLTQSFAPEANHLSIIAKVELIPSYLSSWNNSTSWSAWNKLFRHSLIKQMPNWPKVILPEISLGEDLYFFTQYLKFCNKATHINETLYLYRKRNSSLVRQTYSIKRFNVFKALDHLIVENKLNEHDMSIVKALQCWHGIEALWAMKRSNYDNKENITYVFKEIYLKYLIHCWKAKGIPTKMRIMPLSIPVMWVVYKIALLKANKK